MSTTLEELQKAHRAERDQRVYEAMMEDFWKRWAPKDHHEAARFYGELSMLVRRVFIDAQEPMARHITAMMAVYPIGYPLPRPGADPLKGPRD